MNEKNTFWTWLTNNKGWIFYGIGTFILGIIISTIFLNNDSQNSVTTTNTFANDADYIGKVEGDKVAGNKSVIHQPPSYRDATVVQGDEGAAIPVASKPGKNNLTIAQELFSRISQGEDVDPQEAFNKMFSSQIFIDSGTEVLVLESNESSIGIGGVVKVRILEGAHKDKEGWVSVSLIKTERRLISKN